MVRQLERWSQGDRLSAEALNGNFLMLYEMVIEALAAARAPDSACVALEMKTGQMADRVGALEDLTAMHAHQRNEKQYVPLSYLGAWITMVNDLRQEVEKAILRIDDLHARLGVDHDDLHARLARIEQQPEPADKEAFTAVARDNERLAVDLTGALAQIVELRHEVKILTDWMLGKDQRLNRVDYAPLAWVGQLLQRIEALEARDA